MSLLCSARDPQPELYPNEHLRKVGEVQAKQDMAYCQALSQQYLQQRNAGAEAAGNTVGGAAGGAALGAIGGAIGGNAGKGAAIGAGARQIVNRPQSRGSSLTHSLRPAG